MQALDAIGYEGWFTAEMKGGDEAWLKVERSAAAVPLSLALSLNTEGLTAGEYRTTVRVTVLEAFYRTLEIPVILTVADPPPQQP